MPPTSGNLGFMAHAESRREALQNRTNRIGPSELPVIDPTIELRDEPSSRDWEIFTARLSILAQLLFGIFSLTGFFFKVEPEHSILISLLILDTVVQGIELCFYVAFLLFNKLSISYRYADWFVTTPTMLVSLYVFMKYLDRDPQEVLTIGEVLSDDLTVIVWMLILNAVMLLAGLLVEREILSKFFGHTIGFIAFGVVFSLLFTNTLSRNAFGIFLSAFVCSVWFAYGVVASGIREAKWRSVSYNILDVLSKNVYGVLISVYVILLQ